MKPRVILYENIEQKKLIVEEPKRLTDQEALGRILDLLDFNAALASQNDLKVAMPARSEAIDWIELKWSNPV